MKMKSFYLIFPFLLLSLQVRAEMSGVVYAGLGNISEESYQRILKTPEVSYVMAQVFPGKGQDKNTERIVQLAQSGKKIILQIWWGAGGRYNWSYHSLVALPFEKEVRDDLFAGIDQTIEVIGSKNIYAVHLLEELGYFGIDIDKAGDWKRNKYRIVDGEEDGNAYNNFRSKDCSWSPYAPNVKRQKENFQKMTGLNLAKAPIWTEEEHFVFDRWCCEVSALAEIAFFNHIKRKYPGIKCFTWYGIRSPGGSLKNSDPYLMAKNIDGGVCDPYSRSYVSLSSISILYPDKELVPLMWGGFDSENFRRERLILAYLWGSSASGFYEGKPRAGKRYPGNGALKEFYSGKGFDADYDIPEIWQVNTKLFRQFAGLPVFRRKNSKILLIGSRDGYGAVDNAYSGFKSIDIVPPGYEYQIDLNKYELIIAHMTSFSDYDYWEKKYHIPGPGLDTKRIANYIKNGGILLLSGCRIKKDSPLFLNQYLYSLSGGENISLTYQPESSWQKRFGLEPSYSLELMKIPVSVVDKTKVEEGEFGYLLPYGKGFVYYVPFYVNRQIKEESLKSYQNLLRDFSRGLLGFAGKKKIADNFICPKGYNYFEVEDKRGKLACYVWLDGPEFRISGKEMLTGDENPVFGPERRAGVVLKEK